MRISKRKKRENTVTTDYNERRGGVEDTLREEHICATTKET
jgi:hypothetical protein